jgi:hypothetical protein
VPDGLKTRMDALTKELEAIRRQLGLGVAPGGGGGGFGIGNENVRGRIGQLKGALLGSTALPTTVQLRQYKALQGAWPKLEASAKGASAKVAPLAKELVNAGVLFPGS